MVRPHTQLHQAGNEVAWWEDLKIDALKFAKHLWEEAHKKDRKIDAEARGITASDAHSDQ